MTGRSTFCLRNRQQTRRIDLELLRRCARAAATIVFPGRITELCLHLVTAEEMARLNEQYLEHDGPTDVITFNHREGDDPAVPVQGEIFACVDVALTQAAEFQATWQEELVRYLVHGLLHLAGYDDKQMEKRRSMKAEEDRVLELLRRRFALSKLDANSKVEV